MFAPTEAPGAELLDIMVRRGGGRRGAGQAEELIAWANRAVDAGLGGPALWTLAGETRPYCSSEIDEELSQTLDEHELPEPRDLHELCDARMLLICRAILDSEVAPEPGLQRASELADLNDRYGIITELAEDIAIMAYGDRPCFTEGLRPDNVDEHILLAAAEQVASLSAPEWLPAYLALGVETAT